MNSYDVRFWDTRKIGDTARGRWRVRWAVAGREHCRSFPARPLADGFLTGLKNAVRDRRPFDPATGLPVTGEQPAAGDCHLVRARPRLHRSQMAAPGPHLPPVGRRGADHRHGRAGPRPARRPRPRRAAPGAVRVGVQPRHPQPHPARRDRQRAGLDRRRLTAGRRAAGRAATIRLALDACARTGTGTASRGHHPAAQAGRVLQRRQLRRRAAAAGRQPDRPDRVENPRRRPDRRPPRRRRPRPGPAACSPPSAASATAAQHLEAFYACLYYALPAPLGGRDAPREPTASSPAAAGAASTWPPPPPAPASDWTDDGTARQARGLKHRAQHETRSIPIPPVLVQILRAHLKRYGTTPDGRIFRTARGGHHPGQRLQRRLGRRPRRRAHPRPARLPARPPPLRPAARRRLPVAELRRARHRSRPPRRAQRRRPAQDLRPLHRRPGRRRQQAHRRRPRRPRGQPG